MDNFKQLYLKLLDLHIKTKTVCPLFHEKSQDWYELAFDIFHEISEKRQDIEIDSPIDIDQAHQEGYDTIESIKNELDKMIKWSNSYGMDNLLRGLYDKIEFACGNARGFLKEEQDEYWPNGLWAKGLKPKK